MSVVDGRVSIKIRKHLRKAFFAEPHPTQLLNELLEKHYGYKIVFRKTGGASPPKQGIKSR